MDLWTPKDLFLTKNLDTFYITCVITSSCSNNLAFSLSALFSYLNLWSSLRVWITVDPPKECPITAILSLSIESYVKKAWHKCISISQAVQRIGRDFVNHKIIISQAWLSTLILRKEIYTHMHPHTHTHPHMCTYTYTPIYMNTSIQKHVIYIYTYKTYPYIYL